MYPEINSSGIRSIESTLAVFSCQLLLGYHHFRSNCHASSYTCALNADGNSRAQLLMEHSYPFSHYCLLYVRFTRTRGSHQRIMHVFAQHGQEGEQACSSETPVGSSEQKFELTHRAFFSSVNTPDVIRYVCKHASQRETA